MIDRRLLLLVALAVARTGAGMYSATSKVIDVDASSFDAQVLNSKVPVLVEFYAPWCGHCQKLAPTYENVAKSLTDIAKVVAVDADNEKNKVLAQRYGISGFPTIKLFKNGAPQEYKGARDKTPMVEFVKQNLSSNVKRITSSNIDGFISKTEIPRALFFMPNDDVHAFYKALSVNLSGRMVFGQVSFKSNKGLFEKFLISGQSGLLVFPAQSKDPIRFNKKLRKNRAKVKAFLYEHALPRNPSELKLPKLYDQSCLNLHCIEANAALCAIGISFSSSDFNKLEALSEASEASDSGLCKFSWVEGQKNPEFTSAFGVGSEEQMKLVFFSPRKSRFVLYSGDFTKQDITNFLGNIVKGKAATLPVISSPKLDDSTAKCLKRGKRKRSARAASPKDEL